MALIKCPKCGTMVSDKADACPTCGALVSTMLSNEESNQAKDSESSPSSQAPEISFSEQEYYKSIRRDIDLGNYEAALEKAKIFIVQCSRPSDYTNLITEIKEKWARELKHQAESCEQDGDKETAKQYYEKVLSFNPDDQVIKRKHTEIVQEEERIKAEQDAENIKQQQEQQAKNKAQITKGIIAAVILAILVIGGIFGYQAYQKSLVVDVPSKVTSSEMIALFSSSKPDSHVIAAFSEKYADYVNNLVSEAENANGAEDESNVATETGYASEVIAKINKIVNLADEDDKYILTKNVDIIKKAIAKIKSITELKNKAKEEEAQQAQMHAAEEAQRLADKMAQEMASKAANVQQVPSQIRIKNANNAGVVLRTHPDDATKLTGPYNPHFFTGDVLSCTGISGSYYEIYYEGDYYYIPMKYASPYN